MDKIEALNKLLENTWIYGHQVGFAWYKQDAVMEFNGHLHDERKLLKAMENAAAELAPLFGIKPEEIKIFMIEDGWRDEDWEYIPPFVATSAKETSGDKDEESKVWEIIKENPGELGFILQEKNYEMYLDTFCEEECNDVPITEEQFNLVKNYFAKIGKQ